MCCERPTEVQESRQAMTEHQPSSRPRYRLQAAGFSLVELMVVLVIIGLLAGLVTINVRGHLIRGKQAAAKADIATLRDALESFYIAHDRYPTNEEGITILTQTTDRMPEPLLQSSSVPKDPWGRPYQYNQPGRSGPYEILSLGADGREGGEGADQDVVSWELGQ